MVRTNIHSVPDLIRPEHVLVSVSDKDGLPLLVQSIREINPAVIFYSTGGTGGTVLNALGAAPGERHLNYCPVERLTGVPEMEGGLVKTLTPHIFAGLLAERGNPDHERYLSHDLRLPRQEHLKTFLSYIPLEQHEAAMQAAIDATPKIPMFDTCIVNFYPFRRTALDPTKTTEEVRAQVDIGGPSMVAAGAKNWHYVAVLSHPVLYEEATLALGQKGGFSREDRFEYAISACGQVAAYRDDISIFFTNLQLDNGFKTKVLSDIVLE